MGVDRYVTPIISPRKRSPSLQFLFDHDIRSPSSSNSPSGSINWRQHSVEEEMLSLISYCSFIFTFSDPVESPRQQDQKRFKLNQLLYLVKTSKKPLDCEVLVSLMSMISANLFRPLPPPSHLSFTSDLPDDEGFMATASPVWIHLQVVYDILLRLITTTEPKRLQDHVSHPFLLNLLVLFQSEDPRERESLKNVYHMIYRRFTFHRSIMRKSMNDVLLSYIFETERHCGIGELLEIYGSIINGFTVPLKEEHKLFLIRVLIPMHKPKGMLMYHRQLSYCVSQFVQKEPVLGGIVVRGILRYWPVTNSQKVVLLIGELEELVENIDPDQYRKLALPLSTHITRCLNSLNSQVAERALYVWNNEQFVKMILLALDEVFPVVVEGMEKNMKRHWSSSIRQLTENVKEMLEEMDPILYYKCILEMERRESTARKEGVRRKEKWERIESIAAKNHFL
ncbi:serine/threonine protein phosphatase 2A 57 kDa regulatory subunit B' beta isoform-like [Rhodamnia argentea]|uniref:Serine/threonine protein phosphatase 2A 57 kDa regulatory subunit B' beta isoform-like n=1 Tax=Rhodamnia argentea TaxID=178133 RepID=A0A8B8MM65_9MYRT|nr:serine/threonine protein phosphatase 2A 57 kDa regulatory subunit B' beta isoform-like [Rhodamnia argentea]